jgi:N-acetylmuramoyl-L-alanine amidase
VSNGGGNRNSVGIETSIKNGNSYSRTMRKTANLVVHLLNVFGLNTKRVLQHRNFSGKTCPMSMILATEGCIFEYKQLLDLIEMEYYVMKEMSNAKITFVSNSRELLSDDGYLLKYVEEDTTVKYTVTVEYDGITKTRQFETIVKPNKGPKPQPKVDNASWLKYTIGLVLMWAVLL